MVDRSSIVGGYNYVFYELDCVYRTGGPLPPSKTHPVGYHELTAIIEERQHLDVWRKAPLWSVSTPT